MSRAAPWAVATVAVLGLFVARATFFGLAIAFPIAGPVAAQYHLVASAADLALADRLAGFWWVFGILPIASLVAAVVIAVKAIEHLSRTLAIDATGGRAADTGARRPAPPTDPSSPPRPAYRQIVRTWRATTFPTLDPRIAASLALAVFLVPLAFVLVIPHPLEQPFGVDFDLYRDVTARWLHGGVYFEPYQLAGPYDIRAGDVLYPPVALVLFVPFAIATGAAATIAAIAWWVVPLGITAAIVGRLRPQPVTWPLIALCVANPTTLLKIWTGNPVMWSMAEMALTVGVGAWFGPFVLLKPSLGPFALFGVRRRAWWIGLAVFVLLCVPFGSMWADWVASVANSRGGGLLYSALEVPMLLLPLVAWLGRTRGG